MVSVEEHTGWMVQRLAMQSPVSYGMEQLHKPTAKGQLRLEAVPLLPGIVWWSFDGILLTLRHRFPSDGIVESSYRFAVD